ncbi:uncharacterized protein METZ01_LOCUS257203 [marine metagenome]|uniref:Uncharacterized protein n=1 Tax=marine metagenome TaxID=408172 RepID=A0A382IYC8_9ZZZZ
MSIKEGLETKNPATGRGFLYLSRTKDFITMGMLHIDALKDQRPQ